MKDVVIIIVCAIGKTIYHRASILLGSLDVLFNHLLVLCPFQILTQNKL